MDNTSLENWSSLELQAIARVLSPNETIKMSEVQALAVKRMAELAALKAPKSPPLATRKR
jgi:hypothetical protein